MELSKNDWQLFRKKLAGWQGAYMARLVQQYAELLAADLPASDKFWQLEERINQDKKTSGVILSVKKSKVIWDLVDLLESDVITLADLDGFSPELLAAVQFIMARL